MTPHKNLDSTTAVIAPALSSYTANMPTASTEEELVADVDEPPESNQSLPSPKANIFHKTTILRRAKESHPSLLTQALQSQSDDDETTPETRPRLADSGRRRSMTSTISLASTADLTSDTGLTSPSRTSTPSPPLPEMRMPRLSVAHLAKAQMSPRRDEVEAVTPKEELPSQPTQAPPKRKSISFACAAKPNASAATEPLAPAKPLTTTKEPTIQAPRRPCIKFACPMTKKSTPPTHRPELAATPPRQLPAIVVENAGSPTTARKPRSPAISRSPRPMMQKRTSGSVPPLRSKRYLTANSKELTECSRFHEFASDEHREDDWIRHDVSTLRKKLTINDTLVKENAIRKLGTDAEREAEEEEQEENEMMEAEDDPDNVDEEDEGEENNDEEDNDFDVEDDEHLSGYDSDDGSSGGYHTDEETGFADSDEDDEDGLHLWTPGRLAMPLQATPEPRMPRRSSIGADPQQSDSSIASRTSVRARRGSRTRRIKIRPGTPELPDSTDFVCGTLDEDRPIEDAYISCLAVRKREKMQLIPQDIDPSFPASEPENEEDEEYFNPVHHRDSDDNDVWLHGEMEDLHHEQDRRSRKKIDHVSPKRYHSPPPKARHHSPPPKPRGRSPAPVRRLFDRHSPRRLRSPPPTQIVRSPPASPRNAHGAIAFKDLGCRPGLTQTKSLPRPQALFPQLRKGHRARPSQQLSHNGAKHIRGAIDIVKGLQQKQQRGKEKFYQMYCNRARKGQIPERKPQPGLGAERMRELGLLMAGKLGQQGNYVLSI